MILAVDIGNTTVSLAIVRGQSVQRTWQVLTRLPPQRFKREFRRTILRIRKMSSFEAVVVCSVVPFATNIVRQEVKNVLKLKLIEIGKDIIVPMKNLYRRPKEVGQDRLVGAYAAMNQYGKPLIVIDFGTAVTFDVVSQKGEYMGGAIVPGLRLCAESLFEKTALLPKVKIHKPREIIGRDTGNSILSGIFYGYGALCEGMAALISKKLRHKPKVILTGGYAAHVKGFIKHKDAIDESLIFKGLNLIYEHRSRQGNH